jgi:hypothetical protein
MTKKMYQIVSENQELLKRIESKVNWLIRLISALIGGLIGGVLSAIIFNW